MFVRLRGLQLLSLLILGSCFGQVAQPGGLSNAIQLMGITDADPFDIMTGIYYREYPDLRVEDSIPLNLVRTQRTQDPRSRAFGIGGSTSYDMFIVGDTQKFSWVALVLADGSQIRYSRISPGTGYADGVFENTTAPTEFLGSRILWNRGSWTVKLRNGTEYTVQGCSASSKPGQCAVTGIKNAPGEQVIIQRDTQGNILRITSPHRHYISMKNDSADRIVRAEDDSGHWVTYEYDPAGWLRKAKTWRGETNEFKYDNHFNMVWVGEKDKSSAGKYRFTVTTHYDAKDRFKWQKVDFGDAVQIFAAVYHEDAESRSRQTDVLAPEGLSHYYFNAAGYQVREQFVPPRGKGWRLEVTRDSATNAVRETWLSCPAGRIQVPANLSEKLLAMGDDHKRWVSAACARRARRTE
jgi:YD repeat-containing protein